jgi:hypothetical protein
MSYRSTPLIFSSFSGYRAPCTVIFEATLSTLVFCDTVLFEPFALFRGYFNFRFQIET